MRVTRSTLLKIADDTVARRTRQDRGILSVYLSGSLLGESFILGGTADIDLFFIHFDTPVAEREIVRLTDEIHLDLAHYPQKDFQNTRILRADPWLGPAIFNCQILYDPQHFMDFTQASVRGQFDRSDFVLERARHFSDDARRIWLDFYSAPPREPGPAEIAVYLRAVENAVNSVAVLNGPALTERRLLLDFPLRAEQAGHPGLYPGLLGLLGAPKVEGKDVEGWLPGWQDTMNALPVEGSPPRLHAFRHAYYLRAFEALLQGNTPSNALWPILRTWTQAAGILMPKDDRHLPWQNAFKMLGLLGADFAERIEALDAFLDLVEEVLERWERQSAV